MKIKHLDLFSGIGGASLALDSVFDDVEHEFCDIEPFSQAVLKKHWPNAIVHGDIKELRPGPADIVTGGFPCQPFSSAGKRRGTEDDRHLWPEMLRVIRESSPSWVVGENVGGLLTWNGGMVLDGVFSDLEAAGYEVWAFIIPACAVNAPHRRDRVWIVAHADRRADRGGAGKDARSRKGKGLSERDEMWVTSVASEIRDAADTSNTGLPEREQSRWKGPQEEDGTGVERRASDLNSNASYTNDAGLQGSGKEREGHGGLAHRERGDQRWNGREDWLEAATRLCSLDDGLPGGLARPRGWRNAALKAAGNAWVPQVAEEIFRAIKETGTL